MDETTVIKERHFYAEPRYDTDYRFRLWVAAVDDHDLLGGHYRTYFDQIIRCYEEWRRANISLYDHKGDPLNLDNLKADDLWGFLGLDRDLPTGPGRNISHHKAAVLDVYFKVKYPAVAKSFLGSDRVFAMVETVQSFLCDPDRPVDNFLSSRFLNKISGIYVPKTEQITRCANAFSKETQTRFDFHVPVYSIQKTDDYPFCIVRRISIPFTKYILIDHEEFSKEFRDALSISGEEDTRICTGVGFAGLDPKRRQIVSLNCILRDRTTYAPYFSNISFTEHSLDLRKPSNMAEPSLFIENSFERNDSIYLPLLENGNIKEHDNIINLELFSFISEIANKLGTEV